MNWFSDENNAEMVFAMTNGCMKRNLAKFYRHNSALEGLTKVKFNRPLPNDYKTDHFHRRKQRSNEEVGDKLHSMGVRFI